MGCEGMNRLGRQGLARPGVVKRTAAAAALMLLVQVGGPLVSLALAADCPVLPESRAPKAAGPVNLELLKRQLREYQRTAYMDDLNEVYAIAEAHVKKRLGQVSKPAVVLDIDETALSNLSALRTNDYSFFVKAAKCDLSSGEACSIIKWIEMAQAEPIPSAVAFHNAMKGKNVAVFFITGRRDSLRDATIKNLEAAGFGGFTGLVTRANDDTVASATAYKTQAREKIQAQGYTIVANIGDQLSDLDDGRAADCAFKLPNPFYFID